VARRSRHTRWRRTNTGTESGNDPGSAAERPHRTTGRPNLRKRRLACLAAAVSGRQRTERKITGFESRRPVIAIPSRRYPEGQDCWRDGVRACESQNDDAPDHRRVRYTQRMSASAASEVQFAKLDPFARTSTRCG